MKPQKLKLGSQETTFRLPSHRKWRDLEYNPFPLGILPIVRGKLVNHTANIHFKLPKSSILYIYLHFNQSKSIIHVGKSYKNPMAILW